jgi:hypothetical protein
VKEGKFWGIAGISNGILGKVLEIQGKFEGKLQRLPRKSIKVP